MPENSHRINIEGSNVAGNIVSGDVTGNMVYQKDSKQEPDDSPINEGLSAEETVKQESTDPTEDDESLKQFPQVRCYLEDRGVVVQRLDRVGKGSSQSQVYRLDAPLSSLAGIGVTGEDQLRQLAGDDSESQSDKSVTIALKVANEDDRKWLAREAKILHFIPLTGRVGCIPMVLDTPLKQPERDVLPLQYIYGRNLFPLVFDKRLQELGASTHNLTTLAKSLWDGLCQLHQHQVAHRDLRLPNIMIVESGQTPVWNKPVILDFGLAYHPDIPLIKDDHVPEKTSAKGYTPGWRVPNTDYYPDQRTFRTEQAIDTYMWAINVYMIFTGKKLFTNHGEEEEWANTNDLSRIAELRQSIDLTHIPKELQQSLSTALEHNPQDRSPDKITKLLQAETSGLS